MRKSGFTLIELMIVLAVIATIAAITVPNLLRSRTTANETSAIAGLKVLVSTEGLWLAQNPAWASVNSYWTYDISCFYRFYVPGTQNRVAYIDIAFAKADVEPAADDAFTYNYGAGTAPWANVRRAPKAGYWYRALRRDETGAEYNQIPVGNKNIRAANTSRFGFMCVPDVYGSTGLRSFIVNQTGTVYGAPTGSDNNLRWKTNKDAQDILTWPGADPTRVRTPLDVFWTVVQ